jgi:mannosyltransferase
MLEGNLGRGLMQSTNALKQTGYHNNILSHLLAHQTLFVLVLLFGAALRLFQLGTESLWLDERIMVDVASRTPWEIIIAGINGRPPVFVMAAHFWMRIFGTSEVALRSLPALFNIGALVMLYVVGRELAGRQVALLAMFVMSIAEITIYHAQDYRYYSLWILMSLMSMYGFIKAIKTRQWQYWLLWSVATILVYYTHSFGIFFLVAQNLYFVARWFRHAKVRWQWIAAHVPIGLSLAPALFKATSTVTDGSANVLNWIPQRPVWYPLRTLYLYVFPAREFPNLETMAVALLFFGGVTALVVRMRGKEQWAAKLKRSIPGLRSKLVRQRDLYLLLACWLIVPIAIPYILSYVFGPMYLDRYTLTAAPAMYVLVALGLLSIRKFIPLVASLGMLVILIAPGLYQYYALDVKQQFREVAAYLDQYGQPGDLIVYVPGENGTVSETIDYYYQGDLPHCDIDSDLQGIAIQQALDGCVQNNQRLWVLLRGEESYIGHLRSFFLKEQHSTMQLVESHQFEGLSLHEFEVTR